MRKKYFVAIFCFAVMLVLGGCAASPQNQSTSQAKDLQEQVSQLEEQIQALQQELAQERAADSGKNENSDDKLTTNTDTTSPSVPNVGGDSTDKPPVSEQTNYATTYTMDELTEMVSDYAAKADAAKASGSASDDLEQFFALKQEEKSINDTLDRHENELEYLYHQNQISGADYRKLDMELEQLEDQLDRAEDRLELIFGIDD